MKQITLIQSLSIGVGFYPQGSIIRLPTPEADDLVNRGMATEGGLEEEQKPAATTQTKELKVKAINK